MKNSIRAIIVDDEKQAREILNALINDFCPDVKVIGTAHSVKSGIELIRAEKPDLVFLDIDMADGYGFDILEQTDYSTYSVVFTTAYNAYAAKAFEYSALHYLLKPIDIEALVESVERHKRFSLNIQPEQVESLKKGMDDKFEKINLQINNTIVVVNVDEILYLSSEDGITILYLQNNQVRLLPNSLNYYENLLHDNGFYRVHAKNLVNLRNVKEFKSQGRLGELVLLDETKISISARKKTGFTKALKDYKN
ncbi:MAG: response regulator transcription factor [Bacteroidia bacterium]